MLRTAGHGDAESAVGVLVQGFAEDPLCRWLFPVPEQYQTLAPHLFGYFVDLALQVGTVCLAEDLGVAVWLKGAPTGGDADEAEGFDAFGEAAPRLAALTALVEERHPDEPHWYLPCIAVAPDARGAGVGGALLEHGLRRCEAQGVGAYLEASSERNRALYRRHGFAAQGNPIRLPDGPNLFPMWRKHPDEHS